MPQDHPWSNVLSLGRFSSERDMILTYFEAIEPPQLTARFQGGLCYHAQDIHGIVGFSM